MLVGYPRKRGLSKGPQDPKRPNRGTQRPTILLLVGDVLEKVNCNYLRVNNYPVPMLNSCTADYRDLLALS